MDNNGWPGKPGVPMNPERDGWHWLRTPDENDAPYEWRGSGECERGRWPAYWVPVDADDWQPAECTYLGPCLTPAEVDARVKQARRDALEEAALAAENEPEPEGDPPPELHGRSVKNIAIASVRATKRSIAAAIRVLKSEGDE